MDQRKALSSQSMNASVDQANRRKIMEAHMKAMEALDKINERHMACVRNEHKMKQA